MRNQTAFSIVEVLVALVVFSIAATGSAAAIGIASRAQRQAIARREALSVLQRRIAMLRTAPCDSITTGTTAVSGIQVTAEITRSDSLMSIVVRANHGGARVQLATDLACD